ncbi:hypothetical protein Aperf_G00000005491 [Anoplocephala perfoliata]
MDITASSIMTNYTPLIAVELNAEPPFPYIDPDALIFYSNSCDSRLLDPTDDFGAFRRNKSHIILLVFAAIAEVLGIVALAVLTRPGASRIGSMRKSLVALTAVEMWLNSMIFVNKLWEEYTITHYRKIVEHYFSFVLFLMLNTAICSRNWAVTLLALARCEAITRPVATRASTHIFSPRRQLFYLAILIIISAVISTFRLAIRPILICTNLGYIVFHTNSNRTSELKIISEKIFFAYQSAIPIIVITIATFFMMVVLLRHRMPSERKRGKREESNRSEQVHRRKWTCFKLHRISKVSTASKEDDESCGSVIKSIQMVRQAQRLPNQIRATRFILLIAMVFIVCEAPVFVAVVCASSIPLITEIQVFTYLRFLIIADSFANFVIYLLASRPFRGELMNLLLCRKTQHRSLSAIRQPRSSRTTVSTS